MSLPIDIRAASDGCLCIHLPHLVAPKFSDAGAFELHLEDKATGLDIWFRFPSEREKDMFLESAATARKGGPA